MECKKRELRSRNFQNISVYSWTSGGDWGFPSPPSLAPALPLLLLYPVRHLEGAVALGVLLISVEVTGMVSSEVLSDKDDIIGILVTATCQTPRQSCRRAARGTCRSKEGEEAAQEPSAALLCSYTAQFLYLFTELPQEFVRMVTKKYGKLLQRIPIKYPSAVPFERSLLLCPNKQLSTT